MGARPRFLTRAVPPEAGGVAPAAAGDRPGPVAFLVVAVLYWVGAVFGSRMTMTPEAVSLLWPANAVLLAAFVRYGGQAWGRFSLIAIGAELAADLPRFTVSSALLFGGTNVLEATVAWLLLRAWGFDPRFERIEDVGRFVFAGPFAGALLGAVAGTLAMSALEGLQSGYVQAVLLWWFGDGLGLLVFSPLLVTLWSPARHGPAPVGAQPFVDAAMIVTGLVTLGLFAGGAGGVIESTHLRPVLLVPFVAYAAVRIPFRWVCVLVTLVAGGFVALTVAGRSPYGSAPPYLQAIWAQEFALVATIVALGVSVLTTNVRSREEELRGTNVELRNRTAALEQSNAELRRLAFVAAHDLQTPLRSISAFSQLLHERCRGHLGPEADDWIRRTGESTRRLEALLRDLGSLATIDAATTPFAFVDVGALCDDIVDTLRPRFEACGGRVTRDALPVVRGDREQLARVFEELFVNAIKFRGDAPPRIHVSARPGPAEWVFSVRDEGRGIPPEDHPRVFDLFYRHADVGDLPGTGFGLAMCARIVHRHGGRIWVESATGAGSTFSFTLPHEAGPA